VLEDGGYRIERVLVHARESRSEPAAEPEQPGQAWAITSNSSTDWTVPDAAERTIAGPPGLVRRTIPEWEALCLDRRPRSAFQSEAGSDRAGVRCRESSVL
jgi:hypothetical protein